MLEIRKIEERDYVFVGEIYRQGFETGVATFQNEVPSWEDWDKSHLPVCRFAAFEGEKMTGWAALTPVSGRCVYAGVAEVSVYIGDHFRGNGIGALLLNHLIKESEKEGFWTLQSGIFPENKGSIRLHEKCGFRQIGYREKIGKKDGAWKDNIILEKRSKTVGIL
jgi:L-amino acid N-acyltransferase YncA